MPFELSESERKFKGQVDQCRGILHQIMGEIDDHFVEYLMLQEKLTFFEGEVVSLARDLEVLGSVGKPNSQVEESIQEKQAAFDLYQTYDVPDFTTEVQASTDKFLLYVDAVQQLHQALHGHSEPEPRARNRHA